MIRKRHVVIMVLAICIAIGAMLWMSRSAAQCEPGDLNCMNLP